MDTLDVRVLDQLLEDGRTPYRRIGGSVSLTTNAVKSRVKKTLVDGVVSCVKPSEGPNFSRIQTNSVMHGPHQPFPAEDGRARDWHT
jgi:hypothetical protein